MSKLARKVAALVADAIVIPAPDVLRRAMALRIKKRSPDVFAELPNKPDNDWGKVKLPNQPVGFEDLAPLFTCRRLNRGLARLDFDEAASLFRVISQNRMAAGVEIGRFNGGSTLILSVAMPGNGKLLSIDIAPQDDASLSRALKQIGTDHKIELRIADANAVEFNQKLDFAFIDGDHSYEGAKKDHLKWGAYVRKGGFIIHHDMGMGRSHSTQVPVLGLLMRDILHHQQNDLKLREETASLVIFERTSESWNKF